MGTILKEVILSNKINDVWRATPDEDDHYEYAIALR